MTSTIGVKKIQYPNGTDILTLDSSGSIAIADSATVGGTLGVTGATTLSSTLNVTGATTTTGDITTSNSSGHRSLTVKGNSTTNYQGGSLLLANSGMDTNYGGTYLYHHKAGGSGTDDAAFNISQRSATGAYVSNIWNVDYKNNAHAFYVPNGGASGATVLGINGSGHINMSQQPFVSFQGNSNGNTTVNNAETFGATDQGNPAFSTAPTKGGMQGITYTSTNGRFTVPTAGRYLIFFQGYYNAGAASCRIASYINGVQMSLDHNSSIVGTLQLHYLGNMSANDYVDFRMISGGNQDWYMGINHMLGYIVLLN